MKNILDILKLEKPYDELKKLHDNGDLKIIFPELVELDVIEQGHKNNFYHTLLVLKNVCDANLSYNIKIIALLHDIGKIKAKHNKEGKWTFHNHENIGAKMSIKILKDWNITDDKLIDYVYRMILYHGRLKIQRDVSESAIRRLTVDIGADIIFDLIEFCKCDMSTKIEEKRNRIITGLDTIKNRIIEINQKDEEAKWRSPLTGQIIMDLLKLEPCKLIGDIKKQYEPLFKENKITLDEAIIKIIKEYGK